LTKTPFGTPFEPEEEELEAGLRRAYEKIKNTKMKVQITHVPPYNTKLDIITSGAHVGSHVVRKLIEELKPNVAICAHIHEARGVDFIGDTKIINAGRFPEGYCGVIDIDESNSTVSAKVVNLI
jgi:Icc-related predicted phosphoesterase